MPGLEVAARGDRALTVSLSTCTHASDMLGKGMRHAETMHSQALALKSQSKMHLITFATGQKQYPAPVASQCAYERGMRTVQGRA